MTPLITGVRFHRFKQFRDHDFVLRPTGVSLIAGGNNAGKSSLLHGLAIWEFCRTAIEMERGAEVFVAGAAKQGLGLGDDQFSPIEVPSLRHLWTNLTTPRESEPDGYTLKIRCEWLQDEQPRFLEIGLALANDRLFIKPTESNLTRGERIPRIAYLPPFAGITARETRMTGAIRRRRIGEGLAGAVLRNLLLDMWDANQDSRRTLRAGRSKVSDADLRTLRATDSWELLQAALRETFAAELVVAPFSEEYHSYIQIEVVKGSVQGFKLRRFDKFRNRDLMVEGSGFLQWVSVFALALDSSIDLLLLDEPDSHLHTQLQEHLLTKLEELGETREKQILIATHSAELLRNSPASTIMHVRGKETSYLSTDGQKVALLAGLGSDYAPRIDRIRRSKRVLFVEGVGDLHILKIFARTLGVAFPDRWVEWRTATGHKERRHVFAALREEIPELTAISLRDRDDEPLASVGENLDDLGLADVSGMTCLKWRRRYIEGYVVWPPAIAAASGLQLENIVERLASLGLAITDDSFVRADAPEAILDMRAKAVLKEGDEAVLGQLPATAYDVAREIPAEMVPADVRIVLDRLIALAE